MWSWCFKSVYVFLVLVAAICQSDQALASEPIRLGISLGLTGQYQQPAIMQKRAYELWRDEINGRGGILGRAVELVIRDDTSDPALALNIYKEFIAEGSVDQLFAPYSSQLTLAVGPTVDVQVFPCSLPERQRMKSGARVTIIFLAF